MQSLLGLREHQGVTHLSVVVLNALTTRETMGRKNLDRASHFLCQGETHILSVLCRAWWWLFPESLEAVTSLCWLDTDYAHLAQMFRDHGRSQDLLFFGTENLG